MIKLALAALWISAATTGAIFVSFQWTQPEPQDEAEPNAFEGLDYVESGIISVPLLGEGSVKGYFLARLVYTAEGTRLAEVKLPVDALLSDAVYSHLYANPQIDFSDRDSIDLDAFRSELRDNINARLGEELLEEILVEQIDYLAKNEIQATSIRGADLQPEPAAPAGH